MGEDELAQAEKPGGEGTEAITTGWQFTGLLGALRGGAPVIRKSTGPARDAPLLRTSAHAQKD
jgi:hypothetical protein